MNDAERVEEALARLRKDLDAEIEAIQAKQREFLEPKRSRIMPGWVWLIVLFLFAGFVNGIVRAWAEDTHVTIINYVPAWWFATCVYISYLIGRSS